MPRLKPKVIHKKLSDVVNVEVLKRLREQDKNFSLSKIFRPHMTKFVNYNHKPVVCYDLKRFVKKFKLDVDFSILELMDKFYADGFNPVLAGGKLISFLNGEKFEESTNDYDLYFVGEDDRQRFQNELWDYFKDRNIAMLVNTDYLWEFLVDSSKTDENGQPIKVKIQMMFKLASCVEDIVENFDIRCCAVAYHKGKLYWVKGALRDIKEKKLTLLSPRMDIKGMTRITKYLKKGYDIAIPDLLAMSVLSLEPIVTATQHLEYDQQSIDVMTDRNADFDRFGYTPEDLNLDRDLLFDRALRPIEQLETIEFTPNAVDEFTFADIWNN